MNPTRLICLAAAATFAVAACGDSKGAEQVAPSSPAVAEPTDMRVIDKVEHRLLAVDATASTSSRSADVALDLQREIANAYMALGGAGSYLTVANFAGGPADVRSVDDFELCSGGQRQCADEVAQAERVSEMVARVTDMLADSPSVGGSDPVGYLYHQLSQLRQGFEENPTKVIVWSDFISRSDALLLDGTTDISTPEARSTVIDSLAVKGLDFSAIDLSGVVIEVRLVPTDISGQSPVYAEFVRSFAEELLARTKATVVVSLFTSTTS